MNKFFCSKCGFINLLSSDACERGINHLRVWELKAKRDADRSAQLRILQQAAGEILYGTPPYPVTIECQNFITYLSNELRQPCHDTGVTHPDMPEGLFFQQQNERKQAWIDKYTDMLKRVIEFKVQEKTPTLGMLYHSNIAALALLNVGSHALYLSSRLGWAQKPEKLEGVKEEKVETEEEMLFS